MNWRKVLAWFIILCMGLQGDLVFAQTGQKAENYRLSSQTDPRLDWTLASEEVDATRLAIMTMAIEFLGTPYQWGGSDPDGFDCSGLVYYIYGNIGIQLGRTAEAQSYFGREVTIDKLQAGDLVFWSNALEEIGHVGIYMGDGLFIHAPRPGEVVQIGDLTNYPPIRCRSLFGE